LLLCQQKLWLKLLRIQVEDAESSSSRKVLSSKFFDGKQLF
jgi:hypothetical protein